MGIKPKHLLFMQIPEQSMFVNYVAEKVCDYIDNNIYHAVIFPSVRAGVYFRRELANICGKDTIMLPDIYSIRGFIEQYSNCRIMEKEEALFILYEIYKKLNPDKKIDIVYPLLNTMLTDFSDIDRMIKEEETIKGFFENLKKIALLEEDVSLNRKYIEKHIYSMEIMEECYYEFKNIMEQKQACFQGYCYRKTLENVEKISKQYETIIFAGFNALTTMEKEIMLFLKKENKAKFIWDISEDSINDGLIGGFVRDNRDLLGGEIYNFVEKNKKVQIVRTATPVSQSMFLSNMLDSDNINNDNMGIILSDESLLLPVLESIPEKYGKFNVTMGFLFVYTAIYEVIKLIIDAHLKKLSFNAKGFYKKDIDRILRHPLINRIYKIDINENNMFVLPRKDIVFMRDVKTIDDFFEMIDQFVEVLIEEYGKDSLHGINVLLLREKTTDIKKYIYQLNEESLSSLINVYMDMIKNIRIPFAGEPIENVQIMGLLETRGLSFENLFILSVNEGIMPSNKYENSFIPMDMRKYYGLFMPADEDGIFAYYFFRLIEKSKNVYIFYYDKDMEDNIGVIERSRFISYLLKNVQLKEGIGSSWHVEEISVMPYFANKKKNNNITKNKDMIEILYNTPFSASSLITYVKCPFKFYVEKVLKIGYEDESDDNMDAGEFGTLIHRVLQIIYSNNSVKEILSKEKYFYDLVYSLKKEDELFYDIEYGKNRLLLDIGKDLVMRIIKEEMDKRGTLLYNKVVCEEKINDVFVTVNDRKIQLKGAIDRIEFYKDKTVIIDYKTGNVSGVTWKNFDMNNKKDFIEKHKEAFQLLFYKYLLERKNLTQGTVYMYIYDIKRGEIRELKENMIDFEELLVDLLGEIVDEKIPFIAQKSNLCEYCSFSSLCVK